jgi:hypothetical protein
VVEAENDLAQTPPLLHDRGGLQAPRDAAVIAGDFGVVSILQPDGEHNAFGAEDDTEALEDRTVHATLAGPVLGFFACLFDHLVPEPFLPGSYFAGYLEDALEPAGLGISSLVGQLGPAIGKSHTV